MLVSMRLVALLVGDGVVALVGLAVGVGEETELAERGGVSGGAGTDEWLEKDSGKNLKSDLLNNLAFSMSRSLVPD